MSTSHDNNYLFYREVVWIGVHDMISEGTFKCISGKDLTFNNFQDVDNQYGSDSDADFGIIFPDTGVWDARGSFRFPYTYPYICETGETFLKFTIEYIYWVP